MNNNIIQEKALLIYNQIKENQNQEVEEVIKDIVEKDNTNSEAEKQKEIAELKKQVEKMIKENQKKEEKIKKMLQINDLTELQSINHMMRENYKLASTEERERIANKIIYLAESIKSNPYLAQKTLETFDLYREKMINRNIEEKDLGKKSNNIN